MKNLQEEIKRSQQLMGISEGLNIPKARLEKDLIDRVIEEIQSCLMNGDLDSIDQLLQSVPKENLLYFLNEDEWDDYKNWDVNNRLDPV